MSVREDPRFAIVLDPRNDVAKAAADAFCAAVPDARIVHLAPGAAWRPTKPRTTTELIVVFGGDGTLARTIQRLWSHFIPFLGVSCGRVGALGNDIGDFSAAALAERRYQLRTFPLLTFDAGDAQGRKRSGVAVNDVWVERDNSKSGSCHLRVSVDDGVFDERVVGNGYLVATPLGSTAYNYNEGGPVVDPSIRAILGTGLGVKKNMFYPFSVHREQARVHIEVLRSNDRTVFLSYDSEEPFAVCSATIRLRPTGFTLAFFQPFVFTERLHRLAAKNALMVKAPRRPSGRLFLCNRASRGQKERALCAPQC